MNFYFLFFFFNFLIFFMFYVLREYRYKREQKYFFNHIFKLSNEILTELTSCGKVLNLKSHVSNLNFNKITSG